MENDLIASCLRPLAHAGGTAADVMSLAAPGVDNPGSSQAFLGKMSQVGRLVSAFSRSSLELFVEAVSEAQCLDLWCRTAAGILRKQRK